MYLPRSFEEKRLPILQEAMHAHPFATLVVHTPDGPEAAHIPLQWVPDPQPFGRLRGHLARANPLWQDFDANFQALAIFHGPHAYISPDWYPGSKTHGKEVPTWNYVVVHARGPLQVVEDPAWLHAFLDELTRRHESGRPTPWNMHDAPVDYIARELHHIVGIEIPLSRLYGKWKASQNRAPADRHDAVQGLRREGDRNAVAMAEIMQRLTEAAD